MKKWTSFEEQKVYKVYSRKCLLWHYCLQLSFVYKIVSQISFNFFCSGDKRLLSDFLRKWGWFHKHNERFPKYLSQKLKFWKTVTRLCRWKSSDHNINIFLSLENPCAFLIAKGITWKSIFNANSELPQNRTEKTNYAIQNNIKVIGCFDWKIVVFQQTVVRVYFILKRITRFLL